MEKPDNLFTAYMDYLRFMDEAQQPAPEPAPQPPTLTAQQWANLERAIDAALDAYFESEKA